MKYNLLVSLIFELFRLNHLDLSGKFDDITSNLRNEFWYLDFLRESCKHLDLKGYSYLDKLVGVDLNDLYISPQLHSTSVLLDIEKVNSGIQEFNDISDQTILEAELNLACPISAVMKRVNSSRSIPNYNSLEEIIDKFSKIVILGGPGSGKTSMLNSHILTMSNSYSGILFPILINVNDFSQMCSNNSEASVTKFLRCKSRELGFPEEFMISHLDNGGYV